MAGCGRCKELFDRGELSLKHGESCPRIICHYEDFPSDDDSTHCKFNATLDHTVEYTNAQVTNVEDTTAEDRKTDSQEVLDSVFDLTPTYKYCGICINQPGSGSSMHGISGFRVNENATCYITTNASFHLVLDSCNEINSAMVASSGSTVMSYAPTWEDIVINDVTLDISSLVEDMYSSANAFALRGCFGLSKFPELKFEPLRKSHDSYVLCQFHDPDTYEYFTPDSIAACKRCFDNSKRMESYKFNKWDCPYFHYLYPDLIRKDMSFDKDRILNSYVCDAVTNQPSFIQSAMVEEMLCAAIINAMTPNYGVGILPLSDSTEVCDLPQQSKYMLGTFCCIHDNEQFRQWLNREQSMMYCLFLGYILINVKLDLFLPFHSIVTAAVNAVLASYVANREKQCITSTVLGNWMSYSFDGSESFEIVANKVVLSICSMTEYLDYIIQMPHMSLFLTVHEQECDQYCAIALNISLDAFFKYNMENAVVKYFNISAVFIPGNAIRDTQQGQAVRLSGQKMIDVLEEEKLEPVFEAVQGHISDPIDDEFQLISDIYKVAQDLAKNGNQGLGLPIPNVLVGATETIG